MSNQGDVIRETMKRDWPLAAAELEAEHQALQDRIKELEDALREAHPPGKASHGNLIDDGIWERCLMCKAQVAAKEDK